MYYEETEWCIRAARAGYGRSWFRRRASGTRFRRKSGRPRDSALLYDAQPLAVLAHDRSQLASVCAHLVPGIPAHADELEPAPSMARDAPQRKVMLWAIADYFFGRVGRAPGRVASQVI